MRCIELPIVPLLFLVVGCGEGRVIPHTAAYRIAPYQDTLVSGQTAQQRFEQVVGQVNTRNILVDNDWQSDVKEYPPTANRKQRRIAVRNTRMYIDEPPGRGAYRLGLDLTLEGSRFAGDLYLDSKDSQAFYGVLRGRILPGDYPGAYDDSCHASMYPTAWQFAPAPPYYYRQGAISDSGDRVTGRLHILQNGEPLVELHVVDVKQQRFGSCDGRETAYCFHPYTDRVEPWIVCEAEIRAGAN